MRRGKVIGAGAVFLAAVVAVLVLRSRSEIPVDVFEARMGPIEEIGIRKAVGARNRDILAQFLLESTALSSSGGIGGILVGVFGGWGIRQLVPKVPVEIPPWAILLAFTFPVFVGIFFGVYPARQAAFLHPIEALRYE